MNTNNQTKDSTFQTVDTKLPQKRSLKEISNYQELFANRSGYQITKAKKRPAIYLRHKEKVIPFPLYDEEVIHFPEGMNTLLKTRKQDDDCESDDEVLFTSIKYAYNNLIKGLSQENNKNYIAADFLSQEFKSSFS